MTRRQQLVFDRICQTRGISGAMSNDEIREAAEAIGDTTRALDVQLAIDAHIPRQQTILRDDILSALEQYDYETRHAE